MTNRPSYTGFYLDGREDARAGGIGAADISLADLAKKVIHSGQFREDVHAAAAAVVKKLEHERTDWIAENKKMLKRGDFDGVLAFDTFQKGRVDELSHTMEPDVIEAMEDELDGIANADDEDHEDEDDHPQGVQ